MVSLPISFPGSKQSSVSIDSELKAFDDVLVGNLMVAMTGEPATKEKVPLLGLLADSTGIQLNTNTTGAKGWEIIFGSEHTLYMYKAPTKAEWLALKNVLIKMGYGDMCNALYDECYNDTLPENEWSAAGSCEIYPVYEDGMTSLIFYFR